MTPNNHEPQINERRENECDLNLDEVLSTQPELGPSIPDGGYGWVAFIGTLFFQALVPCLIVNFGIFLAFSKLENGTASDKNVLLWDDKILNVALFFAIGRNVFDPLARHLTSFTTTPRLLSVVGTCLTCAGLLFLWMGMTANSDHWLYAPAGLLSGLGASILLVQCEVILHQYFRLKIPILNQITEGCVAWGFLISPIIIGHNILTSSLTKVLLWYQVIILQGLIVSLLFKKPLYLKSKKRSKPYQFVLSNPDDEEDILSKNSRELQIKRQNSTGSQVSKISVKIPQDDATTSKEEVEVHQDQPKNWVPFSDEEDDIKYAKLNDWEVFDEDSVKATPSKQNWENFEDDDDPPSPRIVNTLSLAEETNSQPIHPSPLFADFPVNNNNTYAYDDEIVAENTNHNVFMPNAGESGKFSKILDVLKELTFYKSLLMMIANTYSWFIFFALYPSYLFIQADSINIRHMSEVVGFLSFVNLFLVSITYWVTIDSKKRAICLWVFYWVGSVGYFMIADFTHEKLLLLGGVQIILSIGALEHISKPLLMIPARGGTSAEHCLLTILSGLALFLFLVLDVSFKTCFRLVAVMHFFIGSLWLANFVYKKLRIR